MRQFKLENQQLLSILLMICLGMSSANAKMTKDELLAGGTPEEQGEAIAIEFDNRDLGFLDVQSDLFMILRNAYGQENKRRMRNKILERPSREVGDKSMLIFDSPRDVKGTALLSYAEILDPDDQWLYLPSLKRVKRISSKNKSGPFVGSEFAFEDITGNEVGKYSWRFEKLETCPVETSLECFKLSSIPKYKYSGYTKRDVWIDVEEFRVFQVDFYDRKSELMKTQLLKDYKLYLDKHWRAHKWEMVNHQTGKSTDLIFGNYEFKTGLTDKNFNKASLKRAK